MSIDIAEYTIKPIVVLAVKLTLENVVEVAEWCGGKSLRSEGLLLKTVGGKWRQVRIGQIVSKNDLGWVVYDEEKFHAGHDLKERVLTVP